MKISHFAAALFLAATTVDAQAQPALRDPLRVEATSGPRTIPLGAYQYDAVGNITAIGSDQYVYDGVGRVTSGTVSGHVQAYEYDAFGNRKSAKSSGTIYPCHQQNCGEDVDGLGELGIAVDPATNRIVGSSYAYDADGNMTASGSSQYTWSPDGVLEKEVSPAGTRQYLYTASGERIAVNIGANWAWSLRDESGRVLRELASSDTSPSNLTQTNVTWRRDLLYRGTQLLGVETPSGAYTYHLDHLGTPRLITENSTGRTVGEHKYLPFGPELVIPGYLRESPEEHAKFTGHERDLRQTTNPDAAMLDYMHARYYAAPGGRFLSVDPSNDDIDPRRPQTWNKYAYVQNNPINKVDPDGKAAMLVTAGVGALTGAGFQIGINLISGDDWDKDVVQEMAVGAALGVTGVGIAKVFDKGLDAYRATKASKVAVESGKALQRVGSTESKMLAALKSHIDRNNASSALFKGFAKTEEAAMKLTQSILKNKTEVITGKRYIDTFDKTGRGVWTTLDGQFVTFISR